MLAVRAAVLAAALLAVPTSAARYSTQEREPQGYTHLECRVDDPLSCSQAKGEVCIFDNGQYRCACPPGVSRLGDGRCKLLNECLSPTLNSCHKDARCVDLTEGYTCQCNPGFADVSVDRVNKPGRLCQKTQNECQTPQQYGVDCDNAASCVDNPAGYQCVCQPGYTDVSSTYSKNPGRKCVEVVNECKMGTDDCSPNADCIDLPQGYDCRCRAGYVDASPNVEFYPGRVCNQPREPEYYGRAPVPSSECFDSSTCGPNEECTYDRNGRRVCKCVAGAVQDDTGRCRSFNGCQNNRECDQNAQCTQTYSGIECKCKAGFLDVSPDPVGKPGRKCQQLVNECAEGTHDCDCQAECIDTQSGYICRCPAHLTDVSSRYGKQPGRKCAKANRIDSTYRGSYCKDKSQNSCDVNADCVELPDGYTCKCFNGYVDVSSNANLPPGRVCTLHTQCPSQPTDLVFLIDGSGSIGSYIFQTDVLRFVSEFTELFDIGKQQTRVAVVQYSDQIRHEFSLSDCDNAQNLHQRIQDIDYLTGLTRTGAAIEHVATEAFSERRGARPRTSKVARVAIVITDGRSQDNVTIPSGNARRMGIQLFAVGVTNHVLDSELETIAGSPEGYFHVNGFEDLNTRLRSLIQKVTCPPEKPREPTYGPCDPSTHNGCDRSKNEVCKVQNGRFSCGCPKGFDLHPILKTCGGDVCNPQISTSCPDPEVCEKTPFGNWRCICAEGWRDPHTGACKLLPKIPDEACQTDADCLNGKCTVGADGTKYCECLPGFELNAKSDKCQRPGTCDPNIPDSCDSRKREQCLPDSNTGDYSCQCPAQTRRHPVTGICLDDECNKQNECDPHATCYDTDESYICTCNAGYIDMSPDLARKPGRTCVQEQNECVLNLHNCSINARCIDLRIGFMCECKEGFIDFSPNPTQFAGTECRPEIDECSDRSLNNCSENAYCRNTRDSYVCICKEGYVDTDALRLPGRKCEKINQICETHSHDCSPNARCFERGANDYECACNSSFLDMSPDPERPGRVCVERVCLDPSKNKCHPAAICQEVATPEKYKCTCRDGYYDANPFLPGHECVEEKNECLFPNECDEIATCHDLKIGYNCTCPVDSVDKSPDPSRPGRVCHVPVHYCQFPQLTNCSRYAECIEKEDSYDCRCKSGFHDARPSEPGRDCVLITNECLNPNIHKCHKHAKCTDTLTGFYCTCEAPYEDTDPSNPGHSCVYNECNDPNANECDKNADCYDTPDSYYCICKEGYIDLSTDPKQSGYQCIARDVDPGNIVVTTDASTDTIKCGNTRCKILLGEICLGDHCACAKGQARATPNDRCEAVVEIPIVVRVTQNNGEEVFYSNSYSSPNSPPYIEVASSFTKGVDSTVKKTELAPKFIGTDVLFIASPKLGNPDWHEGILINSTLRLKPGIDKCKVYKEIAQQIESQGLQLEDLTVSNLDELDPCKEEAVGIACGSTFCNLQLGEICVAGRACTCPEHTTRAKKTDKCVAVESWNLPIYVVRDNASPLKWSFELANPGSELHRQTVQRFETGTAEIYRRIPIGQNFVRVEVNDIEEPSHRNASWESGALFNVTVHFKENTVATPRRVFTDLIEYIVRRNNMEIGSSKLFISPDQMDPFGACYHSDCGPHAICRETGASRFECSCPSGYLDMLPSYPGHDCVSLVGTHWCQNKTLNRCSENARCIELERLYRCECNAGFKDESPADAIPGSICKIDYCSDINFCPKNSTCHNLEDQAKCVCKPGFVDLRQAVRERLEEAHLENSYCKAQADVDYCALGLHNCSQDATCINVKNGYTCQCNEGFADLNEALPGRSCAALLCGQCNGHGDCIRDSHNASAIVCHCLDGYSGEFCEVAPSKAGLILALILALLFLLLTLLCCLWACTRCRCFGGRGASVGTSGQEIVSDYYTIPRAKLKPAYAADEFGDNAGALQAYLDDGASISSGGSLEEIERRVTTDVTTREIRTTTITDAAGNVHTTQAEIFHNGPIESVETEAEQFAMTSSDHFTHAGRSGVHASSASRYEEDNISMDSNVGNAVADRVNHASQHHEYESGIERRRNEYSTTMNAREEDYATVGEMRGRGNGDASMDRNTKFSASHDFQPGYDPRTGTERRKNEIVTTTTSNETNYF